jgi:hypothetical protein
MIIFTLCSNNYLAQAKILCDSITAHHPDYTFIFGLVDELNQDIDYSFFSPHLILPVEKIAIPDFDGLWKKFNIIEFNTSVKASYFKYLFKSYPGVNTICYLDPDIRVYHPLNLLEKEFELNEVLIVPHILTPINIDGQNPAENLFLNYGLYNLGFIGLHRNCTLAGGLLDWWEERTLNLGYDNPCKGLFVDQLWINLVPLFFEKVKILKNAGLNMAPWNLHERRIKAETKEPEMIDGTPLYFFHFSSYKYREPERITLFYNRYDFNSHPELEGLYLNYHNLLLQNNIETYSRIPCAYVIKGDEFRSSLLAEAVIPDTENLKTYVDKNYRNTLKSALKLFLPPVLLKARKFFFK